MSGARAPIAVEQAQRRLRDVLAELRKAAEQALDTRQFYRLWLTKLVEAVAPDAADCRLLKSDGEWELVHQFGATSATNVMGAETSDDAVRIAEGLAELRRTGRPVVEDHLTHARILLPLIACGALRGAVRIDLGVETEAARQGCLRFVGDAAEAVERFHLFADRREAVHRAADVEDEARFLASVHGTIDLAETTYALANEGRTLVGCDRLTLLVRRGNAYRIAAISGQAVVNRRSGAARSLEALADECAATGETVVYPQAEGADPELTDVWDQYVDENHAERIVVAPLLPRSKESGTGEAKLARPIAAFVAEYFAETAPKSDEMRRIKLLVRCGTSALENAFEHQSIFLLPLWQRLGRWKKACIAPGTRGRTWALIAVATLAALAAATIPADLTVFCRGTLNPAVRRRVFAPLDGTVARIAVKHGDRVRRGQTLVELRNTDLDIAEAEVEGRRTATVEQLIAVERALFDEAKRATAEQRAKLSGERSQLREQIESLDRQAALYAEKRKLLVVESPIDGEITTWNAEDLLENRPVKQGQQLLMVADTGGAWELELKVPDDKSGRVVEAARTSAEPLRVTFSPAVDPGTVREGLVAEIHNSAELRGDAGNTVLVRVAVRAEDLPQRRPGAEVAAHVHCDRKSVGYVWTADFVDFVRSRILFRWF